MQNKNVDKYILMNLCAHFSFSTIKKNSNILEWGKSDPTCMYEREKPECLGNPSIRYRAQRLSLRHRVPSRGR